MNLLNCFPGVTEALWGMIVSVPISIEDEDVIRYQLVRKGIEHAVTRQSCKR